MKKVLIILLLGLCISVAGCNNTSETNEKNDVPVKEEKIETEISEDMNQKIDRFISIMQLKYVNITNDELSENEKLYYVFYIASNKLSVDSVNKESIEKEMFELYGSKVEYNDRDIKSLFTNETIAYYKNDKYVYNHDTAHGVMRVKGYSYEVSRERKNDIIKVELKRVYINCGGDVCPVDALYKDPEYKEKIDVPKEYCLYDEYMPDFCDIKAEEYLKDNLNNLPTLTFEFELENGNPVFSRVYK